MTTAEDRVLDRGCAEDARAAALERGLEAVLADFGLPPLTDEAEDLLPPPTPPSASAAQSLQPSASASPRAAASRGGFTLTPGAASLGGARCSTGSPSGSPRQSPSSRRRQRQTASPTGSSPRSTGGTSPTRATTEGAGAIISSGASTQMAGSMHSQVLLMRRLKQKAQPKLRTPLPMPAFYESAPRRGQSTAEAAPASLNGSVLLATSVSTAAPSTASKRAASVGAGPQEGASKALPSPSRHRPLADVPRYPVAPRALWVPQTMATGAEQPDWTATLPVRLARQIREAAATPSPATRPHSRASAVSFASSAASLGGRARVSSPYKAPVVQQLRSGSRGSRRIV